MPRILGIDYGLKRTGLSVTDPLQLIVTGLETVRTDILLDFLTIYFEEEPVEKLVIGEPTHADGKPTYLEEHIQQFIKEVRKKFPNIPIARQDESFTSRKAVQVIRTGGAKKKKRRDKALVDQVSAILILQEYLGHI